MSASESNLMWSMTHGRHPRTSRTAGMTVVGAERHIVDPCHRNICRAVLVAPVPVEGGIGAEKRAKEPALVVDVCEGHGNSWLIRQRIGLF